MIAWFARNSVAANLLMFLIVAVGLFMTREHLILEVFPEFETETVAVAVSYRGATPAEVEQSVLVRIEEAIQDLVGIEELRSTAREGAGTVVVEVEEGYEPRVLLDDIKNRVDAISTFPNEVERPIYSVPIRRREVIGVVVSGDLAEAELRQLGENIRDDLTRLPSVSQVELTEVRPFEISLELSEETLRKFDLTFDEVVSAVRRSSLDLPAGSIKTASGEIRVRTVAQAYVAEDYRKIVVKRRGDGSDLTLGEVAEVRDGFEENPVEARFNGEPCVVLEVYRVGNQNAIQMASEVKAYVAEPDTPLPPGVTLSCWRDRSSIIEKRLKTLGWSALQGGLLVLFVLGLFLRPSLAGWVCLGIPVSFLGALALMPVFGITINILSVFAFILVLGIVVDDAIVTGENIYRHLERGVEGTKAAIEGTQEISLPVTFGVLTTMVAFFPITLIAGRRGALFAQIPWVVVPVLFFSLIESKLVLPAHLKHTRIRPAEEEGALMRFQGRVAGGLQWFAENVYRPVLAACLRRRYLSVACALALMILIAATIAAGHIRFVFFPRVQSEVARASLEMPAGTQFSITAAHVARITSAAKALQHELIDPETGESAIRDILSTAGSAGSRVGQSNIGRVQFEIVPPEERRLKITTREIVTRWRKAIGPLFGARTLNFRAEIGRGGDPVDIQLKGEKVEELRVLADALKERLGQHPGVFDISSSFQEGTLELQLKLKPAGEHLGLSQLDLARQVRQGFFGEEAQRIQRGRDDVRVMVRYTQAERTSLESIESMWIRTPGGAALPLREVAEVEVARGFSVINRVDRRRTINVVADVDKENVRVAGVYEDLRTLLGELRAKYPRVEHSFAGEAEEQRDSTRGLMIGLGIALGAIFVLLAIAFRSYSQPLIVMSVIPFGWGGAVLGHVLMGHSLSIFSVLGMLALTGIVVNDSLVMVDFINRHREDEEALLSAAQEAGVVRFRAIILTSLTTFVGLVPLIFEQSTQAQFIIPMAVSLGFGVLFATSVTLILVPCVYLVLEDGLGVIRGIKAKVWDLPEDEVPRERLEPAPEAEGD